MNQRDLDFYNQGLDLINRKNPIVAYKLLSPLLNRNPDNVDLLLTLAKITPNAGEAKTFTDRANNLKAQTNAAVQAYSVPNTLNSLTGQGLSQSDLLIFSEGLNLAKAGKPQEAYRKLIPLLSRNKDNVDLILAIACTTPNLDSAKLLVDRAFNLVGNSKTINSAFNYLAQKLLPNLSNPPQVTINSPGVSFFTPITSNVPQPSLVNSGSNASSTKNTNSSIKIQKKFLSKPYVLPLVLLVILAITAAVILLFISPPPDSAYTFYPNTTFMITHVGIGDRVKFEFMNDPKDWDDMSGFCHANEFCFVIPDYYTYGIAFQYNPQQIVTKRDSVKKIYYAKIVGKDYRTSLTGRLTEVFEGEIEKVE